MTEVLIRENFSETTHSVGNIYKKVDEGMWLLCNVDGKAALVSLNGGWFYSESLPLCQGESMHSISGSTFQRICSGRRFDLVKKVIISEE